MIVLACADDSFGMMFNKRRVSRDRILCERISVLTADSRLMMNGYSAELFSAVPCSHLCVSDDFLAAAHESDYCFVENTDITPYKNKISKIILFRWNRKYPSDFKFPSPVSDGWRLTSSEDFTGSSHDSITEEHYER